MELKDNIARFMETCRGFQLATDALLQFQYTVTPNHDAALIRVLGAKGTARFSWSSDGFVTIEAYTGLDEIIFYRQFETKDGWEFLLPSLQELPLFLCPSVLQ